MHFTSSNLLHNFPNGKYVFFSLLKKKKIHVKNTGQPNQTHNPINPTRPTRFAVSRLECLCNIIGMYLYFYPLKKNLYGLKSVGWGVC